MVLFINVYILDGAQIKAYILAIGYNKTSLVQKLLQKGKESLACVACTHVLNYFPRL